MGESERDGIRDPSLDEIEQKIHGVERHLGTPDHERAMGQLLGLIGRSAIRVVVEERRLIESLEKSSVEAARASKGVFWLTIVVAIGSVIQGIAAVATLVWTIRHVAGH